MKNWLVSLAFGTSSVLLLLWQFPVFSQTVVKVPPPAYDEPGSSIGPEKAVFSGGCFWGVQGVFEHVKGVSRVLSGYSGGSQATAEYESVSTGTTGHAESVEVTFDPKQISYGELLQIFFAVAHDPTELDRQGPDYGTQYRSAIFPQSEIQKDIAERYIAQLDNAKVFRHHIATKIENFRGFYPAEAYHQDFLALNPTYPYIVINDLPKVRNLKQQVPDRYLDKPVLVASASPAA
jgi:peptide-methionine (S)-S-oxide reductase